MVLRLLQRGWVLFALFFVCEMYWIGGCSIIISLRHHVSSDVAERRDCGDWVIAHRLGVDVMQQKGVERHVSCGRIDGGAGLEARYCDQSKAAGKGARAWLL